MKVRQSNIELLRIIAMLMVMFVHTGFLSGRGAPSWQEIYNDPSASIIRELVGNSVIVGVNVFLLISGWFGINFKGQRIADLLFQVFFFSAFALAFYYIVDGNTISLGGRIGALTMGNDGYWFVKIYLLLYVMSPIYNSFVLHVPRNKFRLTLILMFVFFIYYGWITPDGTRWIQAGHCLGWFSFVYLLGRYIRVYKPSFACRKKSLDIIFYVIYICCLVVADIVSKRLGIDLKGRLLFYTNPIVLLAAFHLFMFFSKLSFQSRCINWIGASCLAAYLFHHNILFTQKHYGDVVVSLYRGNLFGMAVCKIALFVFCMFVISILLDKIRLLIWGVLLKVLFKFKIFQNS